MFRPAQRKLKSVVTAAVLCGMLATSTRAGAYGQRFNWGITLGSVGGAASLVADFGSLIYIVDREHTGGWGWLSLASGTIVAIGGISLSEAEVPQARDASSSLVVGGLATVAIGLVGLCLPRRGSRFHAARRAALVPLWLPGSSARGLALGGVF